MNKVLWVKCKCDDYYKFINKIKYINIKILEIKYINKFIYFISNIFILIYFILLINL